jgi:peptidoglycan/LPS O-acetylase OafA/YrhL
MASGHPAAASPGKSGLGRQRVHTKHGRNRDELYPGLKSPSSPLPAGRAVSPSQYLPPLTGIRALAALLVLGLHADQNVPAGATTVLPFLARGYLGVDFFFVLSGFIITHVYFASLARPAAAAVRVFLWHRFIRLYPVHVTVLVGLLILVYLAQAMRVPLNSPQGWATRDIPWHLMLLHAWGATATAGWNAPSWSISAEWFAYLTFPLLAPALNAVRERVVALSIAAGALAVTAAIYTLAQWDLNTWVGAPALTRVFGEFLCGAALCRALALGKAPSTAFSSRGWPHAASDLTGATAFLLFLIGASSGISDFVLVALLALTILATARAQAFLARFLGSTPLVWLGEISYSVYMVHFPVLLVLRRFWERAGFAEWPASGKAAAFAATIVLVIGLAAMLFYLVERPARTRLRDRMGKLAPA